MTSSQGQTLGNFEKMPKMYSTTYGSMARVHMCKKNITVRTDQVVSECLLILHILQAIFTYPELRLFPIILGEGREVPCINLKVANLDLVHIFYFCYLKINN